MNNELMDLENVKTMILSHEKLMLAGDERLLKQLPQGDWIAGTIPYFMVKEGGKISAEKIFVTNLSHNAENMKITYYDEKSIQNVYRDGFDNGFSMIIIPAACKTHMEFALNAPKFTNFALIPLVGWIAGINLKDLGQITPKIFNGKTGESFENGAIVMHILLSPSKIADVSMVNIFSQGEGDIIEFPTDSFTVSEVMINGKLQNFLDYLHTNKIDIRFPLVANYEGAMINVSFQKLNEAEKSVDLYAPIFRGVKYRLAKSLSDYVEEFRSQIPKTGIEDITFSCNCILNFLYGDLEGKKTEGIFGPITFGEIVYQLVNQTMVNLSIFEN